jgi:PEP-CTERM motif
MNRKLVWAFVCVVASAPAASADVFVNGDFETGTSTGWTTGSGYRGGVLNPSLDAADLLPGGSLYNASLNHSSIVTAGGVAETGNQLNQVYSGVYSWRVEDTVLGGYGSAIEQRVNGYSDPEIFFAWAAVLEGAHGPTDAATVKILLRDVTLGVDLISREYNAAAGGGGVDPRFNYYAPTNFYGTPWQIERLTLPLTSVGHDLVLSILASDCEPTGHEGFLFLDGFGGDVPVVPEPVSLLLVGMGLAAAVRRNRKRVA